MQECDLVMKGGLTSGAVYPGALVELSRHYRFRNIGGTSAGAIATVFAAAAEFRRQKTQEEAGFKELELLAQELASNMRELFQPASSLRAIFGLLLARIEGRSLPIALIRTFWVSFGCALVVSIVATILAWEMENWWLAAAVILGSVLGIASRISFLIYRNISVDLVANNFGICSGKQQPHGDHVAFTEWIVSGIAKISGKEDGYLTVGDLEAKDIGIKIAAITTDLSSGRPYTLPMRDNLHYFSKSEFCELFDEALVSRMCANHRPISPDEAGTPDDLYPLPSGDDFPLFLIARMSLSFPGLISSVPLWRRDFQLQPKEGRKSPFRRCLFTDGGVSSNFPIQFFDELLPQRPTFGICLDVYDDERHARNGGDTDRVSLLRKGKQTTDLAVRDIGSISAFGMGIVNVAKDWQDTLQSMLPGYADRIVTIRLAPNEGGMNLDMDDKEIKRLNALGKLAGQKLCERFSYVELDDEGRVLTLKDRSDFDQHRYNRAISVLPKIEMSLESLSSALGARPYKSSKVLTGREILTNFESESHRCPNSWREGPFVSLAVGLAELVKPNRSERLTDCKNIPVVDAVLRLTATPNRVPRDQ